MVSLLLLVAAGCGSAVDSTLVEGVAENLTRSPFYTLPSPVPAGKPGDVVRTETLPSAPAGTKAWRVLYHSTDVGGADIITSGLVIAPAGPGPSGGRVVVAWAHPTTGAAAHCAPSNGIDPFVLIEGLPDLLAKGCVVTAADYPGLGVEGQSSYLVGATEAASVLDSVRAARKLPQSGAGDQVLLWGHSQGGHAVLFAAQEAPTYTPEPQVRAAAVAAPAADLAAVSLVGRYTRSNPATTEPWATMLAENTPGAADRCAVPGQPGRRGHPGPTHGHGEVRRAGLRDW